MWIGRELGARLFQITETLKKTSSVRLPVTNNVGSIMEISNFYKRLRSIPYPIVITGEKWVYRISFAQFIDRNVAANGRVLYEDL